MRSFLYAKSTQGRKVPSLQRTGIWIDELCPHILSAPTNGSAKHS